MKLLLLGVLLFLLQVSEQAFKMQCKRPTLLNGRIKIRARGKMVHFRCKKRYTRVGAKFAFCMQGTTWSHPPPLCITRGCPDLGNLPDMQITESIGGAMLKFQCAVGLKRSGPEVITCDGAKWSDSPPKCTAAVTFSCDFEDASLCGWSQGVDDDFDWIRTSGVTPTMNTGPEFDHTFKKSAHGHYMFIESSSPRNSGDKATLISPTYPVKMSNMCVELWYHMLGPDGDDAVGTLEVYIKPVSHDFISDLIPQFYIGGNQGNLWNRGIFNIKSQEEDFQLVIIGTRKDAFVSDIAIDDIRIFNCSEETTTTITTTQPTTKKTTPALVTTAFTNATVTTDTVTNTTVKYSTKPKPIITTKTPYHSTSTTVSTIKTTTVASTTTATIPPPTTTTRTTTTTTTTTTTRVPSTKTTQKSTTNIPTTKKARTTVQSTTTSTMASSTILSTIAPTKYRRMTTSQTTTSKPTITTALPTTKRRTTTVRAKTSTTTTSKKTTVSSTSNFATNRTTFKVKYSTERSMRTKLFDNITRRTNTTHGYTTTTPPETSIDTSVAPSEVYNTTLISKTTVQLLSGETTSDSNDMPSEVSTHYINTTFNNKTEKSISSFIPLIIGISCGIVVGMVAIGILAYLWTRHQRKKKVQELEDQMLFITPSDAAYYAPS